MEYKYQGKPKLRNFLWNYRKRWNHLPSVWVVAALGDGLIKQTAQKDILEKIAQQLNMKIQKRSELTDWRRRQLPKVKIGKYSYYLTPQLDVRK